MTNVVIDCSSSGDNTIIAAPGAHQFIRIYSIKIMSYGTVNVSLKSASTVIDGPVPLVVDSGYVESDGANGKFQLGLGEAFIVNLSGGVRVTGNVVYSIFG